MIDGERLFDFAGYSQNGAVARALAAAFAEFGIDFDRFKFLTRVRGAVFFVDMRLVFVFEILDRGKYRTRSGFAESAKSHCGYGFAKFFKHFYIAVFASALYYSVKNFEHSLRSFSARNAFPARLVLSEVHKETRYFYHTGMIVHNDKSAGTDYRADFFERIEIERKV